MENQVLDRCIYDYQRILDATNQQEVFCAKESGYLHGPYAVMIKKNT